jgi:peptide/nickel transport system substrate-binding protein
MAAQGSGRVAAGRVSRRGALRTAALGAGGAAFLAACGGSGEKQATDSRPLEQKQEEVKSFLSTRLDTAAQAIAGGIYQGRTSADVTNLDPLSSPSFTAAASAGAWSYSRLFKYKTGYRDQPATGEVVSDLVERFEQPEPVRLILKLRQDAVWDERAPTNKRGVDAEDVIFSWKKFETSNINRTDVAVKANPAAPIESIDLVDKYTVAVKTAYPYAPLLSMLAFNRYLVVMPKESDGGFDPRNEVRGSGAWTLANYQRSVKFEYRKNPNWFGKDKPLFDGYDWSIISEYAAGLAQFRAKRLWGFAVRPEDQIATKADLPELSVLQDDWSRALYLIKFGFQPGSPFLDERVRKAVSLLIDRDQFIDNFDNVPKFKNAGWPVETRWHSAISSGYDGYWLDPRSAEIGEGGQWFKYNPAEAKKLLAAAGYSGGISTDVTYISTGQYGLTFPQQAEVFKGMLEANGDFKLRQNNPDYQTEYLPKYWYIPSGTGDFKGINVGAYTTFFDVDGFLFAYYHSKSNIHNVGLGKEGDPRVDQMVEAQRKELDAAKRATIIKDLQKYLASKVYAVPWPGQGSRFTLYWPWVSNRGTHRTYIAETWPQESAQTWWFDKSKYTG